MVVNSQDGNSIRLHSLLEKKLSDNIDLYKQNPEDPDVWSVANAEKDDIQIYDRFTFLHSLCTLYEAGGEVPRTRSLKLSIG